MAKRIVHFAYKLLKYITGRLIYVKHDPKASPLSWAWDGKKHFQPHYPLRSVALEA